MTTRASSSSRSRRIDRRNTARSPLASPDRRLNGPRQQQLPDGGDTSNVADHGGPDGHRRTSGTAVPDRTIPVRPGVLSPQATGALLALLRVMGRCTAVRLWSRPAGQACYLGGWFRTTIGWFGPRSPRSERFVRHHGRFGSSCRRRPWLPRPPFRCPQSPPP